MAVRACYNEQLRADPDVQGRVTIKFTIGPQGSVIAASVANADPGTEAIGPCLVETLRKLQFPPTPGAGKVVVTYPFVFAPGGNLNLGNADDRRHAEEHVRRLRPHLDACFEDPSQRSRRIEALLHVSSSGFITVAEMAGIDASERELQQCLLGVLQSAEMPPNHSGGAFRILVELYPAPPR